MFYLIQLLNFFKKNKLRSCFSFFIIFLFSSILINYNFIKKIFLDKYAKNRNVYFKMVVFDAENKSLIIKKIYNLPGVLKVRKINDNELWKNMKKNFSSEVLDDFAE